MTRKKLLFIANPISGTQDKRPIIEAVPRFLPEEQFDWQVAWTNHQGHAAELASEAAAEGFDICVAIGGDGTVNEVARSLRHTQTALGIIPMGSGNGLARHLLIPMDPEGALAVIADCQIKELDYGLINDIPFFCTCGMGFDAFISEKFADSGKRGLMTYVDNTVKSSLAYKPETYEIEVDGKTTHYHAFLIACGNASQYGNNFYIAPHASMSDGLMDVTILEPFNVLEAAQVVVQMLGKNIDENPHTRSFKCQSMRVHREKPGVIHFDGDPVDAGTDLEIKLIPRGLHVVVNERGDRSASPVQHIFQDLMDQINTSIRNRQHKLQRSGKELLERITPKK